MLCLGRLEVREWNVSVTRDRQTNRQTDMQRMMDGQRHASKFQASARACVYVCVCVRERERETHDL